jgi:hypothetical protein
VDVKATAKLDGSTVYIEEHPSVDLNNKMRWFDIASIVTVYGPLIEPDSTADVYGNHRRGNHQKVTISDRCEMATRNFELAVALVSIVHYAH